MVQEVDVKARRESVHKLRGNGWRRESRMCDAKTVRRAKTGYVTVGGGAGGGSVIETRSLEMQSLEIQSLGTQSIEMLVGTQTPGGGGEKPKSGFRNGVWHRESS